MLGRERLILSEAFFFFFLPSRVRSGGAPSSFERSSWNKAPPLEGHYCSAAPCLFPAGIVVLVIAGANRKTNVGVNPSRSRSHSLAVLLYTRRRYCFDRTFFCGCTPSCVVLHPFTRRARRSLMSLCFCQSGGGIIGGGSASNSPLGFFLPRPQAAAEVKAAAYHEVSRRV